MLKKSVYLDHAATTPVDPRVVYRMRPYYNQYYGNPSASHSFGQSAEAALEETRKQMAGRLCCAPHELLFTSGGSESDNLALRGAALSARAAHGANHILISSVEHDAVHQTAAWLATWCDFEFEVIPADSYGLVDPDHVSKMIRPDTALVSVIYANNEIGTINDVRAIGNVCHAKGVLFHSDAVQAIGSLSLDLAHAPIDLFSISAHKFYGPKGAGALYIRAGTRLTGVQTGGKQEFALRAGTQNVAHIVGMGEALKLVHQEHHADTPRLIALREYLISQILSRVPDSCLTGHSTQRLPHHASFVFKNVESNALLAALDLAGYACSSTSACKTGDPEPSRVLQSLGLDITWLSGSLRVTMGHETSQEDIDGLIDILPETIRKLRSLELTPIER